MRQQAEQGVRRQAAAPFQRQQGEGDQYRDDEHAERRIDIEGDGRGRAQ